LTLKGFYLTINRSDIKTKNGGRRQGKDDFGLQGAKKW
jgi:hypothetical protein